VSEDAVGPAAPDRVRLVIHGQVFFLDLAAVRQRLAMLQFQDGLSLNQRAASAGVGRMSLWRLLSGRSTRPKTVHRVLRALGLDPRDVLTPSDERT
jgi:predicted transcriptional regulator